jgi:hypothetical protein
VWSQHPQGRLVPNTTELKDWDWADKKFLNYYLCEHVKMFYYERHYFDPVFYPAEEWWSFRKI